MFTFIIWITSLIGIQRVNPEEWKVVERVNENTLATFDHDGARFSSENDARFYVGEWERLTGLLGCRS